MKKAAKAAIPTTVFFSLVLFVPFHGRPQTAQNYSLEEALKVIQAIEIVETENLRLWEGPLRQVIISESELNSYIAYRIDVEREDVMKELRLKLLDKNKIEGKIGIDLRGQNLPQFIRPEMNLYFAADLQTKIGLARLNVNELFIEKEPVQPMILDIIIAITARMGKMEPSSINDWYELPYGIKDIRTEKGKAIFYY